ncbi:MAG TPA: hypothetical protein VD993_13555 [Chitinophagaceae bacterium]|nr:hypothetical protein [Chitinophagaceae bacterium]
MRLKTFIICAFSLAATATLAQSTTFQNAQGIVHKEVTFYNTEGYSIFLQELDLKLDEKGIAKIKKRFSIPKETVVTTDTDFPNAQILTATDIKGESKTQSVYYLSQPVQGKVKVIGFSTLCDRIKSIEKEFYEAILTNSLPASIFTAPQVDTITFAGRSIALGPACHWMDVRNVQCPNLGQMNWSEFSSLERAKQMTAGQQALSASRKMGEVLEETEVNIVFEGQEVKALKRKAKIKVPKLIMGGSNILIVYYVTAEVRGRYVSCVLSHYTDDVGANKLPPLLSEVMQLKQ